MTTLTSRVLYSDAVLKSRFFHGIVPSDREVICAAASFRDFTRDTVVVNQGDPADRLFLLARGSARHFFITPEGRKILLLWLSPGEIFGGASLLSQSDSYVAGTEVIQDSSVLVWPRSKVRQLAAQYPVLLDNSLSIAIDYFNWFVSAHVALVCETAAQRIAGVLTTLTAMGKRVPGGIDIPITNEQLANAANVSLFTASRILSDWQRKGVLLRRRGNILLRSPQGLFVFKY